MILKLYSIWDQAVGAYLQPFFSRSHGDALRSFSDAVNDPKSGFNAHPFDYSLFHIGDFDDGNAHVDIPTTPTKLITGHEALAQSENFFKTGPN